MNVTFEENLIFDQFNKWIDNLDAVDEEETLQKFLAINGATRDSLLAKIFLTFLGGMQAGFNILDAMNEIASQKENEQK